MSEVVEEVVMGGLPLDGAPTFIQLETNGQSQPFSNDTRVIYSVTFYAPSSNAATVYVGVYGGEIFPLVPNSSLTLNKVIPKYLSVKGPSGNVVFVAWAGE